jgi:hypothetical protein
MNDGVYSARASLQINDPLVITRIERIIENRIIRVPVVQVVWRTQTIFVPRDPLAQTFSFTQNQVISSIGLQFTARDPSIPVTVQIRGVTTGLPNGVMFAEKVLAPNEINLSGETKHSLRRPVLRRGQHQLCRGAADQQQQLQGARRHPRQDGPLGRHHPTDLWKACCWKAPTPKPGRRSTAPIWP